MSAAPSEPAEPAAEPVPTDDPPPGRNLIVWSWIGTAVTVVTSIANALTGDREHYVVSALPGLVMLALGSMVFIVAFAVAVQRSRTDEISVAGLFFLMDSAPRRVQVSMLASVAVQTAVPLGVAIFRPFTAFATLAPVWSLGLAGLWGARHGTFPPRRVDPDDAGFAPGARSPRRMPD